MSDNHVTVRVAFACDCANPDCTVVKRWPVPEARQFATAMLAACDGYQPVVVRWPGGVPMPGDGTHVE